MTSHIREVSEYTLAVSTFEIGEMGYNIYIDIKIMAAHKIDLDVNFRNTNDSVF